MSAVRAGPISVHNRLFCERGVQGELVCSDFGSKGVLQYGHDLFTCRIDLVVGESSVR